MKKALIVFIVTLIIFSGIGTNISVSAQASETYELLIIAPAQFARALKPLVEHKISHGVSTKLVTKEDICGGLYFPKTGRDCAEEMKYFIKNALDQWSIKYVLLVGGKRPSIFNENWLLPVRYSNLQCPDENRFLSDLYFADIYDSETREFSSWDDDKDGIYGEWYLNQSAEDTPDLYPDVFVGRLPCRNRIEVRTMVRKIIQYENQKPDGTWFKRMVVVGGDTVTGNDYFEGEVVGQEVLDVMVGFDPVKLWVSDGAWKSARDVVKSINAGCGFFFLEAHGNPCGFSTHPPYDNSKWILALNFIDVPFLLNGKKLPICVVPGCHGSMFDVGFFVKSQWTGSRIPECINWQLVRKIGGGAIASLGNTGVTYIKELKQNPCLGGGKDWLDVLFFKQYGEQKVDILGAAVGNALSDYLNEFPIDWSQNSFNDTALDAKTVQQLVLFGDPSLKIGGYARVE